MSRRRYHLGPERSRIQLREKPHDPPCKGWLIAYTPRRSDRENASEAEAVSDDGVDVTLIRWMLSLTPAGRLRVLESNIRSLEKIRGAADRR